VDIIALIKAGQKSSGVTPDNGFDFFAACFRGLNFFRKFFPGRISQKKGRTLLFIFQIFWIAVPHE
jgi:hypothetical protein